MDGRGVEVARKAMQDRRASPGPKACTGLGMAWLEGRRGEIIS